VKPRILEPAKKIAPSILSADFARLGEEVKAAEEAGADYIHVDIMDGHFVPNITAGPQFVEALRRSTSLPLDVHLMIQNPDRFLVDFIKAGADILTVHVEAVIHLHRALMEIKEKGALAGVSLNPATALCVLEPALEYADLVLVMTVNPGFGGQEFIPSMLPKIEELRRMIDHKGWKLELEVDGGIKAGNIAQVAKAGADVFVSGSGIFKTEDYAKTIAEMRGQIRENTKSSPQRTQRTRR
jgi:ribulose-phosphate 3-epimerase